MTRIRLRDRNPHAENRRGTLWECISRADLTIYKVIPATEAWYVVAGDTEIEKLLAHEPTRNIFGNAGFDILMPPGFNSKRTIVLRHVDQFLTTHTTAEIKENIEEKNNWAKVDEVIKIPNFDKLLKVRFADVSMAKKAKDSGLFLLHQSIPAQNIEQETYINLVPCYICYSYNHVKKDCPTKNVTLCSECGADDHTYRHCHSDVQCCINCGGPHRTLAAMCPTRKQLIRERGAELRKRNRSASRTGAYDTSGNIPRSSSYAAVTGPPSSSQKQQQPTTIQKLSFHEQIPLPANAQAVILSAVCFAHYMEYLHPGTFQENINKMYDRNKLPRVLFPENIDTSGLKDALQRDGGGEMQDDSTLGQRYPTSQIDIAETTIGDFISPDVPVSSQETVETQDTSVKRKYISPLSQTKIAPTGPKLPTPQLDAPARAPPKKQRQYAERPSSITCEQPQSDSDSNLEQQASSVQRPGTPRKLDMSTQLAPHKRSDSPELMFSYIVTDTEQMSQTSTVSTESRDTDEQPRSQRLSLPSGRPSRRDFLVNLLRSAGLEFFKDAKMRFDPHKNIRDYYNSRRIKYQFTNPEVQSKDIKYIIEKTNISLEHIPINNISVRKFLDLKEGFIPSKPNK